MIDTNNLSKLVTGSESKSGAMIFETAAPLDDRTAVRCKAALISQSALGEVDKSTKKATAGKGWIFNGLITADCQTGDVYVLYNRDALELLTDEAITKLSEEEIDEKINKAWKKAASSSDVSSLAGVFQFKGVAEAINPDQSILTTRLITTKEITDEQGKVTIPSESLYCVNTAYEFDMDVYYGWGTSLEDIRFWTDTTTVNNNTLQYDKGGEINVTAYEFNGTLYYPIDSTVAPTAGDPVIPYENVDGKIIYISENDEVYDNALTSGGPIGEAIPVTYTGYDFTVKTSPIALNETTSAETIPASSDNSGHVYQIGENEYASNGQIWVKLGSPVEDWIIL